MITWFFVILAADLAANYIHGLWKGKEKPLRVAKIGSLLASKPKKRKVPRS